MAFSGGGMSCVLPEGRAVALWCRRNHESGFDFSCLHCASLPRMFRKPGWQRPHPAARKSHPRPSRRVGSGKRHSHRFPQPPTFRTGWCRAIRRQSRRGRQLRPCRTIRTTDLIRNLPSIRGKGGISVAPEHPHSTTNPPGRPPRMPPDCPAPSGANSFSRYLPGNFLSTSGVGRNPVRRGCHPDLQFTHPVFPTPTSGDKQDAPAARRRTFRWRGHRPCRPRSTRPRSTRCRRRNRSPRLPGAAVDR